MKIQYVTGSRADFGLMYECLKKLHSSLNHELSIVITGQHTVKKYGYTSQDVHNSGLVIASEIPVDLTGADGSEMALVFAEELAGLINHWKRDRPDLIILLGDRGEMLASAIAAVHLGIHIAHIHGGERSGTLDESFRHAITKLSHIHFPATEDACKRLVSMGETKKNITVIGAPGLVGIDASNRDAPIDLFKSFGLPNHTPIALCVFHPVVQEANQAADQIRTVIETTKSQGYSQIVMRPNSDAGGLAIDHYLDSLESLQDIKVITHLERAEYCKILSSANLLIGNSSSGIIESASFGVACVNIGSRQNDRQRNKNTFDSKLVTTDSIKSAIKKAANWSPSTENIYGDGTTNDRLLQAINSLKLTPDLLIKRNSY